MDLLTQISNLSTRQRQLLIEQNPLSFAQERLWFLNRLAPDSSVYSGCLARRLIGPLHVCALGRSISEIIRRHEILRTTFPEIDGQPLQAVAPYKPVPLPVVDLSALFRQVAHTEALQLGRRAGRRRHDLSLGPLFYGFLLRVDPRDHILLFSIHHIVSDGWSIGILLRDLEKLYQGFLRDAPAMLGDLPIQYSDFARWERTQLRTGESDQELNYWKRKLAGVPQTLNLPTDYPRGPLQEFHGRHRHRRLLRELSDQVRVCGRRHNATLFMTLLSAFAALLYRYSGQDDMVIGTPIANRHHPEVEPLIGIFLNTLAMRINLAGDPAFSDLLRRVNETSLEALAHRDLPFSRIVEEIQLQRDLAHNPLFQVMFSMQNAPAEDLRLEGLDVHVWSVERETAMFDLCLSVEDLAGEIGLTLEYDVSLFDRTTIDRMLEHLEILLRALVADPSQRLSRLPLLTNEQKLRLARRTPEAVPSRSTLQLPAMIQIQAAAQSDAVALRHEAQHLTYGGLEDRSNRLACWLQSNGIGQETTVGVAFRRGPNLVIAILAIWKAGAAFVPVDPNTPDKRLDQIIDDSGMRCILTDDAAWRPHESVACIHIDRALAENHAAVPRPVASDDLNLAYVMYTSGSTGRPKGVDITYSAISNVVGSFMRILGVQRNDSVLAVTALTFDIAVLELFLPLCAGARLEIAEDVARDAEHVARTFRATRPTIVQATPSAWRLLTAFEEFRRIEAKVLCGGEALTRDLADELLKRGAQLWNVYGPTETTVWSTGGTITAGKGSIALGEAIENTCLYILDRNLELVPEGLPGELFIGGCGLARGYRNQPQRTAEGFVPDPFSGRPGTRLYRTGDIVRREADGKIRFLGRRDHQVKIRGHRIELGDVEAALRRLKGVIEAVVAAPEDRSTGERGLVAYVQCEQKWPLHSTALRDKLQDLLPASMIPSNFVRIDKFLLTPSGKIDRTALPAPGDVRPNLNTSYQAPGNPIEAWLVEIWTNILGVSPIGTRDNFFELGGHSLLAVRIRADIHKMFGIEIPLRRIFETPTIAAIARGIGSENSRQVDRKQDAIPMASRAHALPLSSTQRRLWFLSRLNGDSVAYNAPFAARLKGTVDIDALRRAFGYIVERHESLRTRFPVLQDEPVQQIDEPASWSLPVLDLSCLPVEHRESAQNHLLRQAARRPFDLAADRLLRTFVICASVEEHVLFIDVHHIICDAWSFEVLLRELNLLYEGLVEGRQKRLPPLPLQYVDADHFLRSQGDNGLLPEDYEYWQQQLRYTEPIELPLDRPRPSFQRFRGASVRLSAPEPTTRLLQELGAAHGCSLFITVIAAFSALLSRYTGQDDITIGTPVANRPLPEFDGLIGFFANTVVLRLHLQGRPSFIEMLRRAKETLLGALAHQSAPFELLVERLQPTRELSRSPFFDVLCVMHPERSTGLELIGVQAENASVDNGSLKFDLALALERTKSGLEGEVRYNTDLFDSDTIVTMARRFTSLLESAVAHPERPLHQLALGDETIAIACAHKPSAADISGLLHQRFEQHASRCAEDIALISSGGQLTYGELNSKANRLAHHLRGIGIRPEAIVGIFLDRSPEAVIALLAVLKAGGAYLAMDPAYPPERLAFMLSDTAAEVVVTRSDLASRMPPKACRLIRLDADCSLIDSCDSANLPATCGPDNLAYLIYTSGTTGRPKGVCIEHRSVVALLAWASTIYTAGDLAEVVASTSLCFDLSVFELFAPLSVGGTVILVRNALELPERNEEHRRARLLNTVPSAASALLATEGALADFRIVNLAGEPLSTALVNRLHAAGVETVYDLYGPSECTTYSTFTRRLSHEPPSIGRAIAGTYILLLDEEEQLVLPGLPGEIYIGGAGLARGYFNRPEETAERFLPDSFSGESGRRLYRTGDRGRLHTDGRLEFLGRNDRQVKVHGYRIEPAEIEALLFEQSGVQDAVVQPYREENTGDTRLAAYVVPRQSGLAIAEICRSLASRAPAYMIPNQVIELSALPRLPNGKVNRAALPKPGSTTTDRLHVARPANEVQALLLQIWEGLLSRSPSSITDRFLESGGDSLLAARLMARIRSAFGVEIPLRAVFVSGSVAALSECIHAAQRRHADEDAGPIRRLNRSSGPLTSSQERLWLLHQLDPRSAAYNQYGATRIVGALQVSAMRAALDNVVERQEVLRMAFVQDGSGLVQEVRPHRRVQLPVVDLSGLEERHRDVVGRALIEDLGEVPFDLKEGRLFRSLLLQFSDKDYALAFSLHHIVCDGWSASLLLNELCGQYKRIAKGDTTPVGPLPVQYLDYATWERDTLAGTSLARELKFWTDRLSGLPAELPLPLDRPRPQSLVSSGSRVEFRVKPEVAARIRRLGILESATPMMVFMAAFKLLLRRWCSSPDIFLGTPISNRTRPETHEVVGMFVNTAVLRTDLSGNPTFSECIRRVRETVLSATENSTIPFDQLLRTINPQRRPGRHPLFQVWFVFDGTIERTIDGLDFKPLFVRRTAVRHDLRLAITEHGGQFVGDFEYRKALFDRGTIQSLCEQFQRLLEEVTIVERRQPVRLSMNDLVQMPSPVKRKLQVITATLDHLDAYEWAAARREEILFQLRQAGAILLRGFAETSIERFAEFVRLFSGELMEYTYASTPRTRVGDGVYTATEYPADQVIPLHNEMAYSRMWPLRLGFACIHPANTGGATPLADSREVYLRLPAKLRDRFAEKGVLYVRNYGGNLDLSWQHVFGTSAKSSVEEFCARSGIEVEWKSGDGLRTRQRCHAVAQHPETGDPIWFNQVTLFHFSALSESVRRAVSGIRTEDELPRHCFYGDGSPIEDDDIRRIRGVYEECLQRFEWRAADLLLLDNMLVAHGRQPYQGSRRVLVAMGGMTSAK